MKTWHYELLFVGTILCLTTLFFQNDKINWITTVAVLFTFQHAQIADRLQEGQQKLTNPDVKCYWKLNILFTTKEIIWMAAFILMQNYAAIIGCVLFSMYPLWRKIYRKRRPRKPLNIVKNFEIIKQHALQKN